MRGLGQYGIILLVTGVVAASAQSASRQLVRNHAPNDRALDVPLAALEAEFADMGARGRDTTRIIEGGTYSLNARYLVAPEPVPLVHKSIVELYFVRDGSGTLVTGGTIVDGKINGGLERIVKAGDVVFIPPGVPHGFIATAGISYLNVHFGGTD